MYSDAPDFPLSLFLNQEVYCIISAHSHYQFIWKTLTQARIKMKGGDVQRLHGPALISAHWLVGSLSSFFFFLFVSFAVDGVVNLVYHCVKYISKMIF